ncbi:MAG: 23S rRNA (uracil(1939)-C(5))-methyltransferase RlmD [bacterium]
MLNQEITVIIESLEERGYGVAKYEGKTIHILNSLPGEEIIARVYKKKKKVYFAEVIKFLKKADYRIEAKEDHYLSCSPWQIIPVKEENNFKKELIKKFYLENADFSLPQFLIASNKVDYAYRNKNEFSLYGHADEHITLAFHKRESGFHKDPADGCLLAPDTVNQCAKKIIDYINTLNIKARQLKGLLFRYSFLENKVVACIFAKDTLVNISESELNKLLDNQLKGILFIHSDFLSPAFVETEVKASAGDTEIVEKVLNMEFQYAYNGFFQINPEVFSKAAADISNYIKGLPNAKKLNLSDLYAGVGTIGILCAPYVKHVTGVEITPKTKYYSEINAERNKVKNFSFYECMAEKDGLQFINTDILLIDPPRAGLHQKVINQILESLPEHIIYMSCNPKTQAENFTLLKDKYEIKYFKGYNFYPHTPHVESLCILQKKHD